MLLTKPKRSDESPTCAAGLMHLCNCQALKVSLVLQAATCGYQGQWLTSRRASACCRLQHATLAQVPREFSEFATHEQWCELLKHPLSDAGMLKSVITS